MINTRIIDLMLLEIDVQTIFNKIKYDRSLSTQEIKTLKDRLKISQEELKNLKKNAKTIENFSK